MKGMYKLAANLNMIEHQLVNEVDINHLMEHNKVIAREVRLSGSAEELRAFQYAKDTLEGFGISTQLTFHDAYISLPVKACLQIGGYNFPCITHSMGPTTTEEVQGELVYIGNTFDKQIGGVSGKIVMVEGIALPEVLFEAEEAGAIGVIFISGPLTHEMIVSRVWGNPTHETISLMPKIPAVSINDQDGNLVKSLGEKGRPIAKMKTIVETKWTKIPTLTAEIQGSEDPDKFVLLSGHIDSWHHGAMDNGSANATMLEVARTLFKFQKKLRRTLRIAFWSGHSHGRYAGSTAYCDQNWEDIYENCVIHFYVDSVGGKGATILSESNCMAETKNIATEIVGKLTGEVYNGSRYGRSADQSFWGIGIPSLFMGMSEQPLLDDPKSKKVFDLFSNGRSGGFGWWWHTVEDTLDKIDPNNLKRDCEIYVLSIYKVLTETLLPVNHLVAVQELMGFVMEYQIEAGNKIDLGKTMERMKRLEVSLESIQNKKGELSNSAVKSFNKTTIELSRYLVPLNYVEGDRFDYDLAVESQPLPSLSLISKLTALEEDSSEYYLLKTAINRRINKVNYTIKQAIEAAEKLLKIIK